MRQNSLDSLSQDFFFLAGFPVKLSELKPLSPLIPLGLLFLPAMSSVVGASDDFPIYINVCCYAIIAIHVINIFQCIYFRSRKRIARHVQGYFVFNLMFTWIFQLEMWLFFTVMGMALTCTDGGNIVDPGKGLIAFVVALAVLISGIITHVLMYRRMKRRINEGHFRKGGKGLWGDWKYKEMIKVILAALAPIGPLIGSSAVLISKFWTIRWDDAYAPFEMVATPLLAFALFPVFAYTNAYVPVQMYCARRFGVEDDIAG